MCGVGGWVYRMKYRGTLKLHKAMILDIDIVWYDCPEIRCEYRAKAKGNFKQHRAHVHDIGVTWFDCPEHNCSY